MKTDNNELQNRSYASFSPKNLIVTLPYDTVTFSNELESGGETLPVLVHELAHFSLTSSTGFGLRSLLREIEVSFSWLALANYLASKNNGIIKIPLRKWIYKLIEEERGLEKYFKDPGPNRLLNRCLFSENKIEYTWGSHIDTLHDSFDTNIEWSGSEFNILSKDLSNHFNIGIGKKRKLLFIETKYKNTIKSIPISSYAIQEAYATCAQYLAHLTMEPESARTEFTKHAFDPNYFEYYALLHLTRDFLSGLNITLLEIALFLELSMLCDPLIYSLYKNFDPDNLTIKEFEEFLSSVPEDLDNIGDVFLKILSAVKSNREIKDSIGKIKIKELAEKITCAIGFPSPNEMIEYTAKYANRNLVRCLRYHSELSDESKERIKMAVSHGIKIRKSTNGICSPLFSYLGDINDYKNRMSITLHFAPSILLTDSMFLMSKKELKSNDRANFMEECYFALEPIAYNLLSENLAYRYSKECPLTNEIDKKFLTLIGVDCSKCKLNGILPNKESLTIPNCPYQYNLMELLFSDKMAVRQIDPI
jgi:hypothetical protein